MTDKIKKTPKKSAKKVTSEKAEVIERPTELHPLQTLRSEIDSLFDNMLSGFPSMRLSRPSFDMDRWRDPFRDPFRRFEDTFSALSKLAPRADLKETDKTVTITAELPGVAEADIDISFANGQITVSAEKREETRKDDENYHLSERHYGSIKRTFTLPDAADVDKANATFKDGVLNIEVPKKALPKAAIKKIPVKG
ncbi:MAG: Hsp20/alpha crystallin family protein [Rhodospirillales bacterium]|nr:Hsp20/alpha crystallin family protein [Rhodospirillales bacterium]